jgi:hypothetical protein
MCLRHLLYTRQDLSMDQDMDTQRMREGERLILIHRREKCTVVSRTGQTMYLLLKSLALQTRQERYNYIGPVSKTAFAGLKALHHTTLESRAIHRLLQDAEAIYTIYVAPCIANPEAKTAVKVLTTSGLRTKSAVAVYPPEDTAIHLLYPLRLLHTIAMRFRKPGYPSMRLEPKSPGRVHGDWNTSNKTSLIIQKIPEIQRSRADKRE